MPSAAAALAADSAPTPKQRRRGRFVLPRRLFFVRPERARASCVLYCSGSMHRAALFTLLTFASCAAPPRSTPSLLRPSDVLEFAALPPGYSAGEVVSESCSGRSGLRAIHEESLADVDCSVERLSRALRARAAELSSRVLVGKQCRQRGRARVAIHCSATVAVVGSRSSLGIGGSTGLERPAPSAPQVLDLDEPHPRQSAQIRVSFLPSTRRVHLPSRSYHRVDETAQPSVGRALVGQVSARCDDCDARSLRHALRITAGRVGAGEVASVRCFVEDDSQRCVGTALEPWSF
jgi:hypothetical protein